jgi:hypothetical protein
VSSLRSSRLASTAKPTKRTPTTSTVPTTPSLSSSFRHAPIPPLTLPINTPLLFAPHAVPLLPPSSLNRSVISGNDRSDENTNTLNTSLNTSLSSTISSTTAASDVASIKKEPISSVKQVIMAASIGRRAKNARKTVSTSVKPSVEITWATVQERGFKEWLNHILCPSSTTSNGSVASTLCNDRRMADAFRVATQLYNTTDIQTPLSKVDQQIEGGQLGFHTGRNLYDDLRLRTTCTNILLQYSSKWLWLGLSVLAGRALPGWSHISHYRTFTFRLLSLTLIDCFV